MKTLLILMIWGFVDVWLIAWRMLYQRRQHFDHSVKTAKKIAHLSAVIWIVTFIGLISLIINFWL